MGETTLQQALADYINVYMPYRNFADRTREEYRNDINDFTKYCERLGIGHVRGLALPIIERYLADLEQRGFASPTRKRRTVAIRSFLFFLFEDGYLTADLGKRVVLPFTESTRPHVLTNVECHRLRKACSVNRRDATIIEILLQTGIRLSELVRLIPDDVDVQARFLRIRGGRAQKAREIPLDKHGCDLVDEYMRVRGISQSGVLFLNRLRQPLGERGVQKMLRKYLNRTELAAASVHTLRHTFGAWHLMQGDDLHTVQALMGHKDQRSTSVYIDLARETKKPVSSCRPQPKGIT